VRIFNAVLMVTPAEPNDRRLPKLRVFELMGTSNVFPVSPTQCFDVILSYDLENCSTYGKKSNKKIKQTCNNIMTIVCMTMHCAKGKCVWLSEEMR
jgi:hypothetical protein